MSGQADTNKRQLPVVRCPSLHRLVKLVMKEQAGRQKNPDYSLAGKDRVVFNSKTGKSYGRNDLEAVRLSDLLAVVVHEDGTTVIVTQKPFYWEAWDYEEDLEYTDTPLPADNTEQERTVYDYKISFSNIVIGDIGLYMHGELLPLYFLKEVHFNDVIFSGTAVFENAHFESYTLFTRCTFSEPAEFSGAHFWENIRFDETTFTVALFEGAVFEKTCFFNMVNFSEWSIFFGATFLNVANFQESRLGMCNFNKVRFLDDAYFDETFLSGKVGFSNVQATGRIWMNNLLPAKSDEGFIWMDLTGSSINNLTFSMKDENTYKRVVLGLHNSNIAHFSCDDRAFGWSKLFWYEKLKRDTTESNIEKCIHELRIKRRMLEEMNWGDLADVFYALIMDRELELKKLEAKKWHGIRKILRLTKLWIMDLTFKRVFKWGIGLRNTALALIGVVAAAWAVFFLSGAFLADISIFSRYWVAQSLAYSLEAFLAISVPTDKPRWFELIGTVEAAVGYVLCTVFVVILARKFMRM